MKRFFLSVFAVAAFAASAGEREDLLAAFDKEKRSANDTAQQAMTTVELTAAAGNSWDVAEYQLYRALDYKLRHTSNAAERLQILNNFHLLSRDIQKVYDTSREGMGSSAGMHIYHSISALIDQHTAILMLDPESEKRWKKIADAPIILHGRKISLEQGKAAFKAKMYGRMETLKICLFPENTFTWQNRDFAIIRSDIPFAGNDDYSTLFLCELKDRQLRIHTKCQMPCFSKWELKDGKLIIYDFNGKREILPL